MDTLKRKLVKPESTLIEQTALQLACSFYEGGRSAGLKSKYKEPKSYAKAYVKQFIPKAVELLMDILANPSTSLHQKDAIYDCFLERTNDHDLASTGIPIFENPLAKTFVSDKVVPQAPLVGNSPSNRIEDLPLDVMLYEGNVFNG